MTKRKDGTKRTHRGTVGRTWVTNRYGVLGRRVDGSVVMVGPHPRRVEGDAFRDSPEVIVYAYTAEIAMNVAAHHFGLPADPHYLTVREIGWVEHDAAGRTYTIDHDPKRDGATLHNDFTHKRVAQPNRRAT